MDGLSLINCLVLLISMLLISSCKTAGQDSESPTKIIYGHLDSKNELKPVILLVHAPSGRHCTGTAVSHNTVLTAAHCLVNDRSSSSYLAYIGENIEPAKTKSGEILGVRASGLVISEDLEKLLKHKNPKFTPKQLIHKNNFLDRGALIFPENTFQHFWPLLNRDFKSTDKVFIAGFGRTGYYPSGNDVLQAGKRRFAQIEKQPKLGSKYISILARISDGEKTRRPGPAPGDSGGPLIVANAEDGNKFYLAGTLWGTPIGLVKNNFFRVVYLNVQYKEYKNEFLNKVIKAGGIISWPPSR
jgi:hypothetical protein